MNKLSIHIAQQNRHAQSTASRHQFAVDRNRSVGCSVAKGSAALVERGEAHVVERQVIDRWQTDF